MLLVANYERIQDPTTCDEVLSVLLQIALIASFIEVLNAALGMTKAQPQFRLLFAVVPLSVELTIAPMLPCFLRSLAAPVHCGLLEP